jgi:hypothetical protein
MTEPVNNPINLYLTPADWTQAQCNAQGGNSPPVWWNAKYTYWNFYRYGGAYPHTIIHTGATALPAGQAIFNWNVIAANLDAPTIPYLFIYRFSATDDFTTVNIPRALGGTGEIAIYLPGSPTYLEWGIINAPSYSECDNLPASADPASVFLGHFDVVDEAVVANDSSLYGNIILMQGTAEISTAQKKFGVTSLELPDTSYAALPPLAIHVVPGSPIDVLSGTGDFTYEFWVYSTDFANGVSVDIGDPLSPYGVTDKGVLLLINAAGAYVQVAPSGWTLPASDSTPNPNAWNHVALVRHAGLVTIYLNGVGGTQTADNWNNFTQAAGGYLTLGWTVNSLGGCANAWFDEVRVSNIARYTADFTPPTGAFTDPIDPYWQSKTGEITITAYPDPFNCECQSEGSPFRTLNELRTDMLYRLGYAAVADNPPPGMNGLLYRFLRDAQVQLSKMPKFQIQMERFFHWTMAPGQRFYGIADNELGCGLPFDPYKVLWVGFEDLNQAWYRLDKGIDPLMYTRAQISNGWPTSYEIRSCVEIFPAPKAKYTLWIKAQSGLLPFEDDSSDPQTTIDDEAVFLMALGMAKAHYGQRDTQSVMAQAKAYITNLVAGSHQTGRYIPRAASARVLTPPHFLPLDSE